MYIMARMDQVGKVIKYKSAANPVPFAFGEITMEKSF